MTPLFFLFDISPEAGALAFFVILIGCMAAAIRPSKEERRMKKEGRRKMRIGDKEYWV